jgi:NitT/TauT family transport system permease protein
VLLPSFRAASVFVIVLSSFWPTLAGTMSGVLNVEKRVIDSAKTLCVNKFTMLFQIILPAALPQVFIGCNQGLSVSFILLTSAEMIGAHGGMGYYVNNYANFGNFTSALSGVFTIGIVVSVITFFFNLLQRFLLKWKQ